MSPRELKTPVTRPEEARLVERLRAGDRAAQTELVRKYQDRLVRQASEVLRDRALAEDVVQETWLVVLENMGRFEGRSTLLTWLTGITLNRAKDMRRQRSRVVPLGSRSEATERPDTPAAAVASRLAENELTTEPIAERTVLQRERSQALKVAIETLPPTQRSVVVLELHGCGPAQTRETLRISDLARRVRLSRARSRLREKLVPFAA
jgi:RNA polymerase sigma-70 factor (ECF subfamily)